MKVTLLSFSGDPEFPTVSGTAWLDPATGVVRFSDPVTETICIQAAFDHLGPVTSAEPRRFLRSLPLSISGSYLRAALEEGSA